MIGDIFFCETAFPDFASVRDLTGAGIAARWAVMHGLIRTARIRLAADGLFEFETDGAPAFVTPIVGWPDGDIEHPDPIEAQSELPILDLVAWHPSAPGRWALFRGAVTVLGLVEPQTIAPFPVKIHRGVDGWFRSGLDGLVILTRKSAEIAAILHSIASAAAEDELHAAELKAAAARPWPIPTITAPRRRKAA